VLHSSDTVTSAHWGATCPSNILLIEHGAEIDARDRKYDATPLNWAIHLGKPHLIDYLSTVSRDISSLAAVGKVERLRSVLNAQPSLAKALRGDRTALFCLPEKDEDLAIEIAELLLSHGADPSFKNSKGRSAAEEAERNGMDALAQLLCDARRDGQ
jgi:ankyrin repeat protein